MNKTSLLLYVIIFLLIGVVGFADKAVRIIVPSVYEKTRISLENIDEVSFLAGYDTQFDHVEKEGDLEIIQNQDVFTVVSEFPLEETERAFIDFLIQRYNHTIHSDGTAVEYSARQEGKAQEDRMYLVITAVYFMMLSFSTMASNEVVIEKTSHVLEMTCSAVSLKAHYFSKLILGWLMVLVQAGFMAGSIALFVSVRCGYDQGEGLLDLAYRLNLLSEKYSSFATFIESLNLSWTVLGKFILSLSFLMLGIGLIQIIMIAVSSRVNSIEEAGALQGPTYLLFLGIYYLVMMLNQPHYMVSGFGYYLSYVPLFSMLFMPVRILMYQPDNIEMILSLGLALAGLIGAYYSGYHYYRQNIFEYRNHKKS